MDLFEDAGMVAGVISYPCCISTNHPGVTTAYSIYTGTHHSLDYLYLLRIDNSTKCQLTNSRREEASKCPMNKCVRFHSVIFININRFDFTTFLARPFQSERFLIFIFFDDIIEHASTTTASSCSM